MTEYRLASLESMEEIYELVQKAIRCTYPKYYLPEIVDFFSGHHSRKHIEEAIRSGSLYILSEEDRIIGTGTCDGNHIGRVYVLPEKQGCGFGTLIMNRLEEKIAEDFDSVFIDASLPACSMYMHRGYKTIDHGIWECENGVIQVYEIMEKSLRKNPLRLRPYKYSDAQHIVNWCKDEESFRNWSADRYETFPITPEDMNRQYTDLSGDVDGFYPMTAVDGNEIVGHMIMRFTDDEQMNLRFGFVIVDDTKRGRGYGKEMLSLALKYAFEILKVRKVTLGVFENNIPAYRCYKSVGFQDVEQGKDEYYEISGEMRRCVMMEVTDERYINRLSYR